MKAISTYKNSHIGRDQASGSVNGGIQSKEMMGYAGAASKAITGDNSNS